MGKKYPLTIVFLFTISLLGYPLSAEESSIPEASITPLRNQLAEVKTSRRSVSSKRRACKKIIRTAEMLVEAQPEASNRFEVLALVLDALRHLLPMEKTQRNRDAFYETCEALAKAPDAYIGYRLNAELLLSDRELSAKDADAAERIKALETMVDRYRDTSAELECLRRIIMIAPQLGAVELKKDLLETICTRFAGDAKAIAFRRELMPTSILEALFSGSFERSDGTSIVFPQDRLGHPYFVVFWSKDSAKAITKLEQLAKEQQTIPDAIEIYSLNVDELPDCGKSVLDSIGVQCTTLRLRGGKNSEAYQTYAQYDSAVIRVNHLGYTRILSTESARKKNEPGTDITLTEEEVGLDDITFPVSEGFLVGIREFDRYFAQLRYLFIGDYLVTADGLRAAPTEGGVSVETIKAIDACFVRPPLRYRLSKAQELANYTKANKLATLAITENGSATDRWKLHNYRIVALMGMANISGSSEHVDAAVKESHRVLALSLPKGADIPARFCLAKSALRNRSGTPDAIVEGFIADCGGREAGFIAYGATCVLAIVANTPELYHRYHSAVLESDVPSPSLNAFASFFRDRYHQYYLFKISPNLKGYRRLQRFAERRHMINNSLTPQTDALPRFDVKTVDGKILSFPETKTDKLTVLVFVEPPPKGDELPAQIYSFAKEPTKDVPNPKPGGDLGQTLSMANSHVNKGLRVAVIFLSDDVKQVKAIQQKYTLPETVALLPGGISNPIVNRLGLLSPDRLANLVLIRRDGTIAWFRHGLRYHNIGKNRPYVTMDGLRHHAIACDIEQGYRALKAKNYPAARKLFNDNLVREFGHDHKWDSSLAHGRALASLALKNYEEALKEIETAISVHLKVSPGRWPSHWEFNHSPDKPCSSMIHMLTTKAKILDHLGRKSEAVTLRNKIAKGATDYPTFYTRIMGFDRPYEAFEGRMSVIAEDIK